MTYQQTGIWVVMVMLCSGMPGCAFSMRMGATGSAETGAETGTESRTEVESSPSATTADIDTDSKNRSSSVRIRVDLKDLVNARMKAASVRSEAASARATFKISEQKAAKARLDTRVLKMKAKQSAAAAQKGRREAHVTFRTGSERAYQLKLKKSLDQFRATIKIQVRVVAEAKKTLQLQKEAAVRARIAHDLAMKTERETAQAREKAQMQLEASAEMSSDVQIAIGIQLERAVDEEQKAKASSAMLKAEKDAAEEAVVLVEAELAVVEVELAHLEEVTSTLETNLEQAKKGPVPVEAVKQEAAIAATEEARVREDLIAVKQEVTAAQEAERKSSAAEKAAQAEAQQVVRQIEEVQADADAVALLETYPETLPEISGSACETAYAVGERTFVDLGLTKARWGWQMGPLSSGTHETPLYAGAAQNDLSKGTRVGTVTVTRSAGIVNVEYRLTVGRLTETHVYAGVDNVSHIAPGRLGHQHTLKNVSTDRYSVSVSGSGAVYVVAHAVVCGLP